jgi:hypothetical protein
MWFNLFSSQVHLNKKYKNKKKIQLINMILNKVLLMEKLILLIKNKNKFLRLKK